MQKIQCGRKHNNQISEETGPRPAPIIQGVICIESVAWSDIFNV